MRTSSLHLFTCIFIFVPIFLLYTDTTSAAPGHTSNFTASAGITEKLLTVVMVKDTWFGAIKYCSNNKLGVLMVTGNNGQMLVYLRHHLLLDEWNTTEPLWTGIVKPVSGTTLYKSTSCTAIGESSTDNVTPEGQQCVAVNMTSDNAVINWFATSCLDKHYFVCSKSKGIPRHGNLTNYVISNIYPDIYLNIISTPNSSLTSCQEKCGSSIDINQVAIAYDFTESLCLDYNTDVRNMPVYVTVEFNETLNNIICVKNLSNTIQYIFPDSEYNVTEIEESVPCTPVETNTTPVETTTTPVETTTTPVETTTTPVETTTTPVERTTTPVERTTTPVERTTTPVETTTTPVETTTTPVETTTTPVERTTTPVETTTTPVETATTPVETTSPSVTEVAVCTSNATQKCKCGELDQLTTEELLLKIEQLKEELMLEKTSLSSYTRKRISAPDHRTSAQVIGLAGALLLAGVVLSIVILDFQHLIRFVSQLKAKL